MKWGRTTAENVFLFICLFFCLFRKPMYNGKPIKGDGRKDILLIIILRVLFNFIILRMS